MQLAQDVHFIYLQVGRWFAKNSGGNVAVCGRAGCGRVDGPFNLSGCSWDVEAVSQSNKPEATWTNDVKR